MDAVVEEASAGRHHRFTNVWSRTRAELRDPAATGLAVQRIQIPYPIGSRATLRRSIAGRLWRVQDPSNRGSTTRGPRCGVAEARTSAKQSAPPRQKASLREFRSLLLILALPTVGLAFAMCAVTTYGPVVLIHVFDSSTKVGTLIGAEGALAMVIPLVVGIASDRLGQSPLGPRLPFVLAGAPLVILGVVSLPFSGGAYAAAGAVLLFFMAARSTTRPTERSIRISCRAVSTRAPCRPRRSRAAPGSARLS